MQRGILFIKDRLIDVGIDIEQETFSFQSPPKSTQLMNKFVKDWSSENIQFASDIPKNCKYIHTNSVERIFVIEEEPRFRTIAVEANTQGVSTMASIFYKKYPDEKRKKISTERDKSYLFHLFFPYVFYKINFLNDGNINVGIYMNYHELNSYYDDVYHLPMYNIEINKDYYNQNIVCMGFNSEDWNFINNPERNINRKIKFIIDKFWSATFNDDIVNIVDIYQEYNTIFNNYFIWEYVSKNDPGQIMKGPYNVPDALTHMYCNMDFHITPTPTTEDSVDSIFDYTKSILLGNNITLKDKNQELFQKNYSINYRDSITIASRRYNKNIELVGGCKIKIPSIYNDSDVVIDSFCFDHDRNEEVVLCNVDGEIKKVSLNTIQHYSEEISEQYLLEQELLINKLVLNDGNVLKIGDIIEYEWIVNNAKLTKLFTVNNFLVDEDDIILITSDYRFLTFNKERIKKFDLNKLNYKIGETYLISRQDDLFHYCNILFDYTLKNIKIENHVFILDFGDFSLYAEKNVHNDELTVISSSDSSIHSQKIYRPEQLIRTNIKTLICNNGCLYFENKRPFYMDENKNIYIMAETIENEGDYNFYSIKSELSCKDFKNLLIDMFAITNKRNIIQKVFFNKLSSRDSNLKTIELKINDKLIQLSDYLEFTVKKIKFEIVDDNSIDLIVIDENNKGHVITTFKLSLYTMNMWNTLNKNVIRDLSKNYNLKKNGLYKKFSSTRLDGFNKKTTYKLLCVIKNINMDNIWVHVESNNVFRIKSALLLKTFVDNFIEI